MILGTTDCGQLQRAQATSDNVLDSVAGGRIPAHDFRNRRGIAATDGVVNTICGGR